MIYPFDKGLMPEINKYLCSKYPEEAGGVIVNNVFIPCDNVSDNKKFEYIINSDHYLSCLKAGDVQCIIHSHDDFPHCSETDMISQEATDVVWGIVSIKDGLVLDHFFWGGKPEPLVGRKFHHGVHDCYGLVRDYYLEKGIQLPNMYREYGWWQGSEPKGLLDGYKEQGFTDIEYQDLRPGDAILFKIRYKVTNHCAVYLGDGLIIHHFCAPGIVSRREPLSNWKKFATHYLRYVGE